MTGVDGKVNCKFVPVYVVKAQGEYIFSSTHMFGLDTRKRYVVSLKFRPLYPREEAFCMH